MAEIKAIQSTQSKVSASAAKAADDFAEAAEADDVIGFVMVWVDRDGEVRTRTAFPRRMEMMGAVEAAKMTVWEA